MITLEVPEAKTKAMELFAKRNLAYPVQNIGYSDHRMADSLGLPGYHHVLRMLAYSTRTLAVMRTFRLARGRRGFRARDAVRSQVVHCDLDILVDADAQFDRVCLCVESRSASMRKCTEEAGAGPWKG